MLKKIVLFALILIPVGVMSQDAQKIAHFNSAEVVTAMPEYTRMQDSLQKTQTAVQNELKILEEEYSKKYTALMEESETLVESIRTRRLRDIQDIEQRAQTFQQQSQQQLQQLYQDLLQPIQQKVIKALEKVGEANNFTYVLEAGALLYISPQSIDATPLVKIELGLK